MDLRLFTKNATQSANCECVEFQKEIVMTKLVTDNQGREVARLARDINLSRSVFQTALTNGMVEKFLRSLAPPVAKHQDVLKFIETIEIELPFDLNPEEYYQDESNRLFVYDGFDRDGDFVQQASSLKAGTKFRLNVHKIVVQKGATDAQIEEALAEGHLFEPTTICGVFATLMSAQPVGSEEGHLLNNGYVNLAYTMSLVARVDRYLHDWEWDAFGSERDDFRRWPRGSQVFSPARDA